jgi:DNA-directed RNA polymerase specialized sigma24 family protein
MTITNETEAMMSVQAMLRSITQKFASRFHLQQDELFQEVQLAALYAVRTHKKELPGGRQSKPLSSWVYTVVTQSLYSRAKHPGFLSRFGKETYPPKDKAVQSPFSLERLLFEVSKEAAITIQLAIEEGVPDKTYVETMLHIGYGWSQETINQIFNEIREALV